MLRRIVIIFGLATSPALAQGTAKTAVLSTLASPTRAPGGDIFGGQRPAKAQKFIVRKCKAAVGAVPRSAPPAKGTARCNSLTQ
jgi:hypothetical protein